MPEVIEIPKITFRGRRIYLESKNGYWGNDDELAVQRFREFCGELDLPEKEPSKEPLEVK